MSFVQNFPLFAIILSLVCAVISFAANDRWARRLTLFLLSVSVCMQAAKKGRVLIFHWRGGYLTKEVLKELLELIRKAGDEKDKTAMVSINWPQAVIRVQYTDMQVQESVTIEEANEEEQYDKAIILFEGLPGDYEDARNNFRE